MHRVIGAKFIEELKQGRYPTLTSLGADLSTDFHVKSLLRDIVRLDKDVSSIEILSFEAENDKPTTLVQIPRTGRYDLFCREQKKTGWVDKVLDGMLPVSSVVDDTALDLDEDDEAGTTREDGARWLITHLGQVYPDEFVKSAQLVGMPAHCPGPIRVEEAQAMLSEMNIGTRQTRVLRQFSHPKLQLTNWATSTLFRIHSMWNTRIRSFDIPTRRLTSSWPTMLLSMMKTTLHSTIRLWKLLSGPITGKGRSRRA
jgi:hypothetical protein